MNRIIAILVLAVLGLSLGDGRAASASETLAERFAAVSPLRPDAGTLVIGDAWETARLLARFGETERAYDAIAAECAAGGSDAMEDLAARLLIELRRYESADSALALRTRLRDERGYYLHQLRRSRVNALAGLYGRSLDLLRRIDGLSFEEFDPYRDLLEIEVLLRLGRNDDAVALAERRWSAGYPRSLTPAFEDKMLTALVAVGRPEDALAFLDTLETRAVQKSSLLEVFAREVDVRFDLGDNTGAIRSARDFIEAHGESRSLAPVETAVRRGNAESLDNGSILDLAGVLVAHRRSSAAEALLGLLRGRELDASEAETARLLRSELLYNARRYEPSLREARAAFADPALERRAKLLRARAYRGAGQKTSAARSYSAFADAYPHDPKAPEALYAAWDLYREREDPKAAGLADRMIETYPSHRYARVITRRIAVELIRRRRYAEATAFLEDALRRWGRQDETFLYYLARAYAGTGREEEGRRVMAEIALVDSFSFYVDPTVERELFAPPVTKLDGEEIGVSAGLRDFLQCVDARRVQAREKLSQRLDPWGPDAVFAAAGAYLTRGLIFLEMGFRDWAEAELRVFESWKGLPPRAFVSLSEVYDEFAVPSRSVRAIQRIRDTLSAQDRRQLDPSLQILIFPTPFAVTVAANCERFAMAPHLVYAMMREESRFDEKAVSGAGARGLLQLMPKTADELAGRLGYPEGSGRDLVLPDFNLAVGVFYASELLGEAKGDPLMMLAGYNAGFSNARRWFGGGTKGRSGVERVDGIDYWETCDYVKKVVESAHIYHDLFFSPRAAANCK